MTLRKQVIDIPLGGEAGQVGYWNHAPDEALSVYNARIVKQKRVDKRAGFTWRAKDVADSAGAAFGDLRSINALYSHNGALLAFARNEHPSSPSTAQEAVAHTGFFSYQAATDDYWRQIGAGLPCEISVQERAVADVNYRQPTVAVGTTSYCYTWPETGTSAAARKVHVRIYDRTSGVLIGTLTTANARNPRVVYLTTSGRFLVFYQDETVGSDDVRVQIFESSGVFVTDALIDANITAGTWLDAIALNATEAVVAYKNSTPVLAVALVDSTGAVTQTDVTAGTNPNNAIAIVQASGYDFIVLYQDTATTDLYSAVYSGATIVQTAQNQLVQTLGAVTVRRICGVGNPELNNLTGTARTTAAWIMWEEENATDENITVYGRAVEAAPLGSSPGVGYGDLMTLYRCAIVSKPFLFDSKPYFVVRYCASEQPMYFLYGVYATSTSGGWTTPVLGKFMPYSAQRWNDNTLWPNTMSDVVSLGSDQYHIAVLKEVSRTESGESIDQLMGVTFDFSPLQIPGVPAGRGFIIGGAQQHWYDGKQVVEQGFHIQPRTPTMVAGALGAEAVGVGAHSIICTYEWLDAQGNKHRSPLSSAASHTAAPAESIDVTTTVPAHTNKTVTEIFVCAWMTEVGGTSYYKAAYQRATAFGTVITINIDVSDTTLAGNEPLYTSGGGLEEFSGPPSCRLMSTGQRVFAVEDDAAGRSYIQYTKTFDDGSVPAFGSELLRIFCPEKVEAIEEMDGRFIVFSRSGIRYFTGEGPSNTGIGTFSALQQLPVTVGTHVRSSVLRTDDGIFFQSLKGIYILARDLTTAPIGLPAQEVGTSLDGTTFPDTLFVSCAAVNARTREVYFCINDQLLLQTPTQQTRMVLNTEVGWWSTDFIAVPANVGEGGMQTACMFEDVFCFACLASSSSNNTIFNESTGYVDNAAPSAVNTGTAYSLVYQTGWINLGAMHGYQRCTELEVSFLVRSACTVSVSMAGRGEGGTATASATYTGGDVGSFKQLRVKPQLQRASAVAVTISSSGTTTPHEGIEIYGISAKIGLLPNLRPLGSSDSK